MKYGLLSFLFLLANDWRSVKAAEPTAAPSWAPTEDCPVLLITVTDLRNSSDHNVCPCDWDGIYQLESKSSYGRSLWKEASNPTQYLKFIPNAWVLQSSTYELLQYDSVSYFPPIGTGLVWDHQYHPNDAVVNIICTSEVPTAAPTVVPTHAPTFAPTEACPIVRMSDISFPDGTYIDEMEYYPNTDPPSYQQREFWKCLNSDGDPLSSLFHFSMSGTGWHINFQSASGFADTISMSALVNAHAMHPPFGTYEWALDNTDSKINVTLECVPSFYPTDAPTDAPTKAPSRVPSDAPTDNPTDAPTLSPTQSPSGAPTRVPSDVPTTAPTRAPTPICEVIDLEVDNNDKNAVTEDVPGIYKLVSGSTIDGYPYWRSDDTLINWFDGQWMLVSHGIVFYVPGTGLTPPFSSDWTVANGDNDRQYEFAVECSALEATTTEVLDNTGSTTDEGNNEFVAGAGVSDVTSIPWFWITLFCVAILVICTVLALYMYRKRKNEQLEIEEGPLPAAVDISEAESAPQAFAGPGAGGGGGGAGGEFDKDDFAVAAQLPAPGQLDDTDKRNIQAAAPPPGAGAGAGATVADPQFNPNLAMPPVGAGGVTSVPLGEIHVAQQYNTAALAGEEVEMAEIPPVMAADAYNQPPVETDDRNKAALGMITQSGVGLPPELRPSPSPQPTPDHQGHWE